MHASARSSCLVLAHRGAEVDAADLLFALDDELDAARQPAVHRGERAQRRDAGHEIALVVRDAAPDQEPVALGDVERRHRPLVERLRGLDVVVIVEEERPLRPSVELGGDHRDCRRPGVSIVTRPPALRSSSPTAAAHSGIPVRWAATDGIRTSRLRSSSVFGSLRRRARSARPCVPPSRASGPAPDWLGRKDFPRRAVCRWAWRAQRPTAAWNPLRGIVVTGGGPERSPIASRPAPVVRDADLDLARVRVARNVRLQRRERPRHPPASTVYASRA